MGMRKLVVIDVSTPTSVIEFPKGFQEFGAIKSANLIYWDVEGVPVTYDATNTYIISPLFFQIRFRESFFTEVISNTGNGDMVPLPLYRLGGWPEQTSRFEIPLTLKRNFTNRLSVELFGEGVAPQPLSFTRAIFWIALDF